MPYERDMKLLFAAIFALGLAQSARADDFAARIAAGRAAAATPVGSAFAQSIMPALREIDSICDPPGTKLPAAALGQLDIVGDIAAGRLSNAQARPATPLAACFIANLQTRRFFAPPGRYPLFLHLVVSN